MICLIAPNKDQKYRCCKNCDDKFYPLHQKKFSSDNCEHKINENNYKVAGNIYFKLYEEGEISIDCLLKKIAELDDVADLVNRGLATEYFINMYTYLHCKKSISDGEYFIQLNRLHNRYYNVRN